MTPATRNRLITLAAIIGFVALLAWSTIETQQTTCRVCINFKGRENCAVASGADASQAVETAKTTACGPVTSGMNDAIACGNVTPVSQSCSEQ
jgi:hypothetical protein